MRPQTQQKINDQHLRALDEEIEIYDRVKDAVRHAALNQRTELSSLRKDITDLQEEAKEARKRDLPSLIDQIHVHHALAARDTKVKLPDMRAPYFAHMKLEEKGRVRDILIGHETFIDTERSVTIIDWRHAPLAKIFFNFKEGDFYEVELPSRLAEGNLLGRRVINFEMGQLIGVTLADAAYMRLDDGWVLDSTQGPVSLTGGEGSATRSFSFGTGQGGRKQVEVAALLDEKQYALLQADDQEPLLVLGGAGSGKTTVALHRVANLFYRDPEFYAQHKIVVIVPEEGLVRLSRKLLNSLKMDRVKLSTFDQWIADQAAYVLRTLPRRLCQTTPSRVIRFKRHLACTTVFAELERRRVDKFAKRLDKELGYLKGIGDEFRQLVAKNLLARIEKFEPICLEKVKQAAKSTAVDQLSKNATQLFKEIRSDLYDLNFDRMELFSSKKLLEQIVANSAGELNNPTIKEVLNHSMNQFSEGNRIDMNDVDADFGGAIDQRDLDDGTPDEALRTIDIEDYAVMFELLKYYTGGLRTKWGTMHSYTHMVIDEAQELSPLELQILGHCLQQDGNVTVAGDAVQQTDPTSVFITWEKVLEHLGVESVSPNHLTTSYRCPETIMNFAYDILGDLSPKQRPIAIKKGVPVKRTKVGSEGHEIMLMLEALEELAKAEPKASIAIVTHEMETAEKVYDGLKDLPRVRLIENGAFDFKPGIDITDVSQVKGLEFDYVIIPDCDIHGYPDTPDARRALHVAVTRAIHQLWVISLRSPSLILPP